MVVHAESVTRTYGNGNAVVAALRGVDLDVGAGELVVIMGPSGSGKSTLLNLLGALDTPTSGEVAIDGQRLSGMDDAARTALRRHRIGFVFQQFHLVDHLTALENVALPLLTARRPRAERADRAAAMLATVGLADKGGRLPSELSGGEQQRVAVARALVHEPVLVLADEPTGNLDSDTGAEVIALLSNTRHAGGHAVVVVTHDPAIASVADRVIRLRDGRIESAT
jgi:putative ABC transport system ATP-binding protein